MALAVNEQSEQVAMLAKEWALLEALQEGTPAMRKGRTMFLPKWPNEEAQSYDARVATATLFPAYRRTVSVMAGKPFAEPVTLNEDVPAQVKALAEDVDRMGVNLHAFASEMFDEAMGYGFGGILVDYPDTMVRDDQGRPLPNQPRRTVAEIEREGIRPYWVRVKHNQILGWRTETRNGRQVLSQLRLLESVEEEDGDFGTKQVQQVRVLFPGGWQLWREAGKNGEWEIYREGRTSLTEIPFAPIYGRREGFMVGKPPMLDLAYLNVKHWQSQSDQDTIEHVARVPILAGVGIEEGSPITVGANCAVNLPLGADLKYVEHTGASIKAGADSLIRLEEQMIQSGAELLVKKPGDRSATESANDAEGNKSDLQRMAEMFMDSLDLALYFTAKFMGLPSGGTVKLFTDFGAGTLSEASAQLVLNIQQGGLITKGTAIKELQRRGVLDETVDAETELALVEAEGPAPGMMTDEEPQ